MHTANPATFTRKLIRPFTAIVCVLMLTRLASAAPDTASIRTEILGMLDQVLGVSRIAGEIPGSSKGDEQFRIFADLKPGAVETFGKAQGFEPSFDNVLGLFQIYHQGFPDSFRQIRQEGVQGVEAGVQSSYNRTLRSDIDVDYRFGTAHLQPVNSDVRAPENHQKFIDRWPGLRNWWDKK